MDLRLLENIIAVADEKSITKAAEKRFITQSALNQQLQKLEAELHTPLFHRARGNWQPTPAGEAYLSAARQMLLMKKDAYDRIAEEADRQARTLTVGLIPERGVDMFTAVYPTFHRRYPHVLLEPLECPVVRMQRLITAGQLDAGLATLRQEQRDHNLYHLMAREEIVLAVPADDELARGGAARWKDAPVTDLALFSDRPFIRIYRVSTMYALTEELFRRAGFAPRVLFSTSSNVSKYRVAAAGLGCALLPATYALPEGRAVYFRLPGSPAWDITMMTRRDAYLTSPQKAFLALCREYWERRIEG